MNLMNIGGTILVLLIGAGGLFVIQRLFPRILKLFKRPDDITELLNKDRLKEARKERKEREDEIETTSPGQGKIDIFNKNMKKWEEDRHNE